MTTLTPEQIEQVKEKFHRYDKNGDGKVTVEEFEAAVGQYLTPEDFAILLEQLNPDHDDEISYEELLAEREREYVANREVDDVERGEDHE